MERLYGTYAVRGEQELLMLMQIAAMKDGLLRWDDAGEGVRFVGIEH